MASRCIEDLTDEEIDSLRRLKAARACRWYVTTMPYEPERSASFAMFSSRGDALAYAKTLVECSPGFEYQQEEIEGGGLIVYAKSPNGEDQAWVEPISSIEITDDDV